MDDDDFIGGVKLNINDLKGGKENKFKETINITQKSKIAGNMLMKCNFIPDEIKNTEIDTNFSIKDFEFQKKKI